MLIIDEEEFRPIIHKGILTNYVVNRFGLVKNDSTDYIIKPQLNTSGYLEAQIYINGKQKKVGLHRLVAIAFIPNPEHKPEVNHIDGIKINNHVSNLEWVTREENMQHASRTGLRPSLKGELNGCAKITEKDAEFICMCLVQGMHPKQIHKLFSYSIYIASDIARKKTWTHVSEKFPIPKPMKHGNFKIYHEQVDSMILCGYTNDDIKRSMEFDGMTKKEIKSLLKNRRQALKYKKYNSN